MNAKIQSFLKELQNSLTLITSDNVNVEAQDNMFAAEFCEADAKALEVDEIEAFLSLCLDEYANNSKERKWFYYCWLDEMVGQLRMSAISQRHVNLPFRAKVNCCSLSELAQALVDYDSGAYTSGRLKVWQVEING